MTPERFARLKHALLKRQHDLTVLADGVHKDHNVSAVIRTCDAVGIAKIHVVSSDDFRRHHMITGGSKRWVKVKMHASIEAAYSALNEKGLQTVAAHASVSAMDYRDFDFTQPTAVVLGSELTGPSKFAIEQADCHIAIPMHGLVESLNVSVAAAVILYEAERQRIAAGLYDRPPPEPEAFRRTLFEWAYPEIALRCRQLDRDYPELSNDGDLLTNPFED